MKFSISKRQKYAALSIILLTTLYFLADGAVERGVTYGLLLAGVALVGSYIVHIPNSRPRNILITSVLPVSLVVGVLLSLIYFPNLSDLFRIVSLLGFGALFYIISLVNNVFLVVDSRQEVIPLYRVAQTWSKILMVVVTIPLLAGMFKISFNAFYETIVTVLIALAFFGYLFWTLKHNPDAKKFKVGELLAILGIGAFAVGTANIAVSFIPTETFLRALFVSSILVAGISYLEAHLKNQVNRKLISEHAIISLIFLVLLFIFQP